MLYPALLICSGCPWYGILFYLFRGGEGGSTPDLLRGCIPPLYCLALPHQPSQDLDSRYGFTTMFTDKVVKHFTSEKLSKCKTDSKGKYGKGHSYEHIQLLNDTKLFAD